MSIITLLTTGWRSLMMKFCIAGSFKLTIFTFTTVKLIGILLALPKKYKYYIDFGMARSVFGIFEKARLKPAFYATETS